MEGKASGREIGGMKGQQQRDRRKERQQQRDRWNERPAAER